MYSSGTDGLDSVVKFRWNGNGVELIGNTGGDARRVGALTYSCHVFVADDQVIYSASDLAAAARCEYALLRSFDAQLGRGPAVEADDDELLAARPSSAASTNIAISTSSRSLTDDDVAVIGRPDYTVGGPYRRRRCHHARRSSGEPPVVYQAAMFDGRFVGFADFLVADGDAYRLRDTKLARSVKVEALLQLAAYADTLRRRRLCRWPTR